ncbi:hypothetical protein BDY19DRAFT_774166 [Irpex rosettiformis]|uniref:Uncharacterized protein n=1 Tax=Irpex rosettiformis TaxID=378272 RepID=A0ACB8U806_9APHY|nr:hypothetical protein BDY19DRAFT_774166 [Irpex rosettiformis]
MSVATFDLSDILNDLPVTSNEITRDEGSISWRKVKLNLGVSRSAAPSPESVQGDLPDFEDEVDPASTHAHEGSQEGEEEGTDNETEGGAEENGDAEEDTHDSPVPETSPLDAAPSKYPSNESVSTGESSLEHAMDALSMNHMRPTACSIDTGDSIRSMSLANDRQVNVIRDNPFTSPKIGADEQLDHITCPAKPRPQHTRLPSLTVPAPTTSSLLGLDFSSPIDLTLDDQDFEAFDVSDEQDFSSRLQQAETFIAAAILHTRGTPAPQPAAELLQPVCDVRREGRYETIYGVYDDDEGYFEVRRPGISRWSASKVQQHRQSHREFSLHPRIQTIIGVIPRDHRSYFDTWFKKNDRVKRVIEARTRRHLRHPEVIPPARGNFVKKAIERFGPTWRPQPSRFLNKLLKKAGNVTLDPLVISLVAPSVPNIDSEMSSAKDPYTLLVQTPATYSTPWAEQNIAGTPPTPAQNASLAAPDVAMIQYSQPTSGSTVPTIPLSASVIPGSSLPLQSSLATQLPTVPTLPYLVSHSNTDGQDHHPYVPTPPLESTSLPSIPNPSPLIALPQLISESKFSSPATSYIPTPSTVQITLPTLPNLGHSPDLAKLSPHVLSSRSVYEGNTTTYSTNPPLRPPDVRAPAPVKPVVSATGLPYLASQALHGSNDIPYIITPPLPTPGLPAVAHTSSSQPVPLPYLASNVTAVNKNAPRVPTPLPYPIILPTLPDAQPSILNNLASGTAPPFPAPRTMNTNLVPQRTNILSSHLSPPSALNFHPPQPDQRPKPPQLIMPTLPPLILPPPPTVSHVVPVDATKDIVPQWTVLPSQRPVDQPLVAPSTATPQPDQRPKPPQLIMPTLPPLILPPPPMVSHAVPMDATEDIVPQRSVLPPQRLIGRPLMVPLTATPYTLERLRCGGFSPQLAQPSVSNSMDWEVGYAPEVIMDPPVQQSHQPSIPDILMWDTTGDIVRQEDCDTEMTMDEDVGALTVPKVEPHDGAAKDNTQAGLEAGTENSAVQGEGSKDSKGSLDSGDSEGRRGTGGRGNTGTAKESAGEDGDDDDDLGGDPPPFDETDPLWEELLAYNAVSEAKEGTLCDDWEDPFGPEESDGIEDGGIVDAGEDTVGNFVEDPSSFEGEYYSSDELDGLNYGDDGTGDLTWEEEPHVAEEDVLESLLAWAEEQGPEVYDELCELIAPTEEAPLATADSEPQFEPLAQPFTNAETLFSEEAYSPEYIPPSITVEHAGSWESPEDTQYVCDKELEPPSFSSTFVLDELDMDVIEEYARLEALESPRTSHEAARIMVVAIQAVAKAKVARLLADSPSHFLGKLQFPSPEGPDVRGVSPLYEYASLESYSDMAPLATCSDSYFQVYGCSDGSLNAEWSSQPRALSTH